MLGALPATGEQNGVLGGRAHNSARESRQPLPTPAPRHVRGQELTSGAQGLVEYHKNMAFASIAKYCPRSWNLRENIQSKREEVIASHVHPCAHPCLKMSAYVCTCVCMCAYVCSRVRKQASGHVCVPARVCTCEGTCTQDPHQCLPLTFGGSVTVVSWSASLATKRTCNCICPFRLLSSSSALLLMEGLERRLCFKGGSSSSASLAL